MVRVGVDENLADELLAEFPAEAQIVRLGRTIPQPVDIDFWILPFYRKDAEGIRAAARFEGRAVADGRSRLDSAVASA